MTRSLLTHLLPSARELAQCDDGVRIRGLARSHWIDYPRATQALEILERLLQTPQRERMPCLLLHGDSNIGKTQVVSKFQRRHLPEYDEEKGSRCDKLLPCRCHQHPSSPSLLFELGAPFNAAARLSALENLSRTLLRKVSARMLIVDEVHHLLAGNYREQRASLNLLKFLANDLKIAVVLVGTQDAVIALQTDPQMVSRFARLEVPRWQETEAFRSLLAAFERILPLRRPSNLARQEMVHAILTASGGLTGEVSRVLTVSAELAIRDGQEAIDLCHIENAARTLLS